jgi:hypothetical protein
MSVKWAAQCAANSSSSAAGTTTGSPLGFDPASLQSACSSSTMLAYPTTLKESCCARDYDVASLVLAVTKHDSSAKKAVTETLKAQLHKQY